MMSKKLLFNVCVLSFLALGFAKAQNKSFAASDPGAQIIQFEDAKFKAVLLSASPENGMAKDMNGNAVAIDTNGDGEISYEEALNIGELYVSVGTDITSMKGIECFTNLTLLTCTQFLSLKSLDLSTLTKLKELNYSGGFSTYWESILVGSLSELILPKTPTLETVNCSNTLISSLDFLSGYPNLKKLTLDYINVENINITGAQFPHLEELSVLQRIPNVTVTVSDLPELTSFNCSVPPRTYNSYTDFYLSNDPPNIVLSLSNLPKVNELNIQAKNITINNLPNLISLSCSAYGIATESLVLNGVPKLTEIAVQPHALKTLDLSNVPNLVTLTCSNGNDNLENVNLSKNINLQTLNLSSNFKLKTLDLSKNINLQTLDLSYNYNLQTLDLSKNTNLQALNLHYCNESLQTLDVSKNLNLQKLDLGYTKIETLDLSKNINLQYLDLDYGGIKTLDPSKNINLQYLDLEGTGIETLDVSKNLNLQTLNLRHSNKIQTLDVSKNLNLQYLDLGTLNGSKIETLDVSKNLNLQKLVLFGTKIETLDVSHNTKLVVLDLGDCVGFTSLYMKNGVKKTFGWGEDDGYNFNGSNLNYVCCDKDEVDAVKDYIQGINLAWFYYQWLKPLEPLTVTSDCGNDEDLTVSNVTENGATLGWSAVAGATSYTIEYRKTAVAAAGQKNTTFADDWTVVKGITATTYTLTGLADGSIYEWRLTAVGSGDETPVSGPFFTTVIKPLGTEDLSPQAKATLYPNPVKDVLYFSANGKVAKAEVYDLNGRLVKTSAVSNNSVNVSSLSKGVYFIILHTDKGTVKEKFIKN